MFLSDILSCSRHIRINLHIIAQVVIFLEPLHNYTRVMLVLGQEFEDALEPQNNDYADILKVLQCFVFSNLPSEILTDDVIKNVCDVITLILAIFDLEPKT